MIRRSAIVAIVAMLLSLLAHVLGLSFTSPRLVAPQVDGGKPDAVELGNAFEDLADAPTEPVQPEPAEAPEPPVETPPEPERAEVPVSEALVASDDPQRVNSPDTGSEQITQPEPPEPEVTEAVDPSDAEEQASDDETATPPVEPDTIAETPQGNPDANTPPVEVPVTETPVAPEPEQLAALPVPESSVVPVIPLEQEAVDPEIPDATVEPTPEDSETPETEKDPDASQQAVTASIRPRLPNRRPPADAGGTLNGSKNFDDLRFPEQVIDSPLTVYRREGLDAFRQSSRASRSGGRGPGNSDVTNYAGQVLVHLNRAPVVYVPVRGFAQVFFEINPDGTLAWVDIVDSSGSLEVERAAKEQVQRAAPFPRPPGGASRKLSFFYQNN